MTHAIEPDLHSELRALKARVEHLEGAFERGRRPASAPRQRSLRVGAAALGLAGLLAASGVLAADQACASGLYCFGAGQPARASEVNANFAQLVTWLESKVGAVDEPDVAVQGNLELAGSSAQNGVETPNDTLYSRS